MVYICSKNDKNFTHDLLSYIESRAEHKVAASVQGELVSKKNAIKRNALLV